MKKKSALPFALVLISLIVTSSFNAIAASDNYWVTGTSMTVARSDLGVIALNDKIYAIGGRANWESKTFGITGLNQMYDPTTNTWVTKQSMPTPRCDFGIAAYNNKIYCIGGYFNRSLNVNEVYDSTTDSWSTLSPPPFPDAITASEVNGKIVVLAINPATLKAVTEVYDPSNDSWEIKAPMPTATYFFGSIAIGNELYVFGGGHYEAVFTFVPTCTVQIYNFTSNSWRYGSPLPVGMQSPAVVNTSGVYAPQRIYVLGGSDNQSLPYTFAYDPLTDTWNNATQMLSQRGSFGVAVVDDVLYAFGGSGRTNGVIPVDWTEKYAPIGYRGPQIPEFHYCQFAVLAIFIVVTLSAVFLRRKPVISSEEYKIGA